MRHLLLLTLAACTPALDDTHDCSVTGAVNEHTDGVVACLQIDTPNTIAFAIGRDLKTPSVKLEANIGAEGVPTSIQGANRLEVHSAGVMDCAEWDLAVSTMYWLQAPASWEMRLKADSRWVIQYDAVCVTGERFNAIVSGLLRYR